MNTEPPVVIVANMPTKIDQASGKRVPSIDLSPVKEYGSLVVCTHGSLNFQKTSDVNAIKKHIHNRIVNRTLFDSYILCIGDVVAMSIATGYMMELHEQVNLLRWNRRTQSYDVFKGLRL